MIIFGEVSSNGFSLMFLGVVESRTVIVHSEAEAGACLADVCHIGHRKKFWISKLDTYLI